MAHFPPGQRVSVRFAEFCKEESLEKIIVFGLSLPKSLKIVLIPVPKTNNKSQTNNPYTETTLFLLISVKNYFSVPLKTFRDLEYKIAYSFGATFQAGFWPTKLSLYYAHTSSAIMDRNF